MSRVRLVFWSIPLLLLLLTLGLNLTLREAVERNTALARAATASASEVSRQLPALAPVIQAELPAAREARVLAYLSAMDAPRTRLREAVQVYKDATNQPGGSSVAHAAAARKLREQIESSYGVIEGLTPPPPLVQAHADYLAGLELELSALDDMLEFYSSFSIQIANRATLRLEDAGQRLERARARFDEYLTRTASPAMYSQTPR
jgi:hypothetical protein